MEDIRIPLIAVEQIAHVIQVTPHERVSERTVEQTVDVPATMERMTLGVPQAQHLRRVVHVQIS